MIDHILQHGQISTADLGDQYGYGHPPRAIRDVREAGIPLDRFWVTSPTTGRRIEARYLQIDHRVPYEVAGDGVHDETVLAEYMLLDASSQRAKSWSCEQCSNWLQEHDPAVCRSCFWAFPEQYSHVAGEQVRRVHIEWRGAEVAAFDRLRARAQREDTTVAALLKQLARRLA